MMLNHKIITFLVAGIFLLLVLVIFSIPVLLAHFKKYGFKKNGMKLFKGIAQHDLLQIQLEVREQTMKNISQEIHDNIGHLLSLVKLHLSSIQITNNPQAFGKISTSINLVSKAVTDLRDLSKTMDAENIVSLGIVRAIKLDLSLIEGTGLVSTSLNCEGEEFALAPTTEIVIYRIVQETLNNIIKHANATKIIISFAFKHDLFTVTISDNGVGFINRCIDLNHEHRNGSGIRNLFNRAKLIKAQMSIDSAPGRGTTVQLSLAVKDRGGSGP